VLRAGTVWVGGRRAAYGAGMGSEANEPQDQHAPVEGPDRKAKRRYPHPRSILCYSRIAHQLHEDGTVSGSMPVLPDHLDAGGRMSLGAMAPLVDLCAGVLGARAVYPDWTATLDFKVHLTSGPAAGRLHGTARPLRVGKTTVLSENRLVDDAGASVGVAHVTFSRLPRRDGTSLTQAPRPGAVDLTSPEEEPRLPPDEYFGLRIHPEEASFELDHHERIFNSFGSIQGGAMGALLDRVAVLCAGRILGQPARTMDLHYSYLAPATDGPFRVRAVPVRIEADAVLGTVELTDIGRDGRQCAVGTARAVRIEP
jgi:uncharacterized protein (TIGR00369 family)